MRSSAFVSYSGRFTAPASFLHLRSFSFFYVALICSFIFGSPLSGIRGVDAADALTANLKTCVQPGQYDANVDYFPEKNTLCKFIINIICIIFVIFKSL